MTDAPELIWRVKPALDRHIDDGLASWPQRDQAGAGATQYVRADLHREVTLQYIASLGQAAEAHAAQLEAEARVQALEQQLAESEAALTRAWEMGRDDAAKEAAGEVAAHGAGEISPFVRRRIRAITPPTDLAERVKGTKP